ncbi:MAG TPA: acyltransferase [Acidimicrobiales bacterium]|nr:acyltransferase [Acidimicrobiales bacterium]
MSRLYWRLREIDPVVSALSRARRRWLLARLRVVALWYRGEVDVSISPSARLGRRLRVVVAPGSRSTLVVGDKAIIGDDVRMVLEGGRAVIGARADLRRLITLVVGGTLEVGDQVVLQTGCSLHCADSLRIGRRTGVGEFTTVVDSSHHYTSPEEWFVDNVHTSPVVIGADCWIGAKVTIGRGVTVGDYAVIGANSLVTRPVPMGHLVVGVPAEVVRPVRLPWRDLEGPEPTGATGPGGRAPA